MTQARCLVRCGRMPLLTALILEPAAGMCGAVVPQNLPVLNADTRQPVQGPLSCTFAPPPAPPTFVRSGGGKPASKSLTAGAIAGTDCPQ